MSKCGKCGGEGHNARSCGKAEAPAKAKAPARKEKRAVAARPSSVTEALTARRDQLKQELAKVESVLETIGELGL